MIKTWTIWKAKRAIWLNAYSINKIVTFALNDKQRTNSGGLPDYTKRDMLGA
ncbi:hypothetical protein GCM10023313_17040 [Mucilaginibacter defluvii]|uniref:Uncharacterized protein n=1 Tax=Mucilaginibacter defluvii TaxID=1196019 RepID=A0ABP9FSS3_9SPHI